MTVLDQILDLLTRIGAALGITPKPTPPPVTPSPPPPVTPPPAESVMTFPAGTIKTIAPNSSLPYGLPWTQVARWEPLYTRAGKEFGVAPLLLAAFSIIETNANHYTTGKRTGTKSEVIVRKADAFDQVPAIGIMQIKLGYHDPNDEFNGWMPEGNIRLGAKLLAAWIKSEGSWEAALTNKYFPGDDAGSGITQREYIRAVRGLIAEVKASWPTEPAPSGSAYAVAGTSSTITLPFPLNVRLIPAGQTHQRPGIAMRPDRFIQHETGNPNPGANAFMHMQYLHNGAEGQQLSYHFTVDDEVAYQMLPVDEVAWHGGDGAGPCNFKGLSCELCIEHPVGSPQDTRAQENAAILCAELMNALGIESLKPHIECIGTDHHCPDRILNQPGGFQGFVNRVSVLRKERKR